jgi:hypothetical protein
MNCEERGPNAGCVKLEFDWYNEGEIIQCRKCKDYALLKMSLTDSGTLYK